MIGVNDRDVCESNSQDKYLFLAACVSINWAFYKVEGPRNLAALKYLTRTFRLGIASSFNVHGIPVPGLSRSECCNPTEQCVLRNTSVYQIGLWSKSTALQPSVVYFTAC